MHETVMVIHARSVSFVILSVGFAVVRIAVFWVDFVPIVKVVVKE
jgi:hypothetical protein